MQVASVKTVSKPTGNSKGLTPWAKGQSGNPRGRPKKDLDLAEKARKHAELALRTLVNCCEDEEAPWPSKVNAAAELLDRGFGRAPQTLEVNNTFTFSEEFENFVGHLNEQRKLGHLKVINGSVAEEDSGLVRLAADVRVGGDTSPA